jgi:predicted amidohydrolase
MSVQSQNQGPIFIGMDPFPRLIPAFPSNLKQIPVFPESSECKIALVSMNIPDTLFEKKEKSKYTPYNIIKTPSKRIKRAMIQAVEKACTFAANVIVFSEYCYPELLQKEINIELASLSTDSKCVIVAGSYACTNKLIDNAYNTSLIFLPGQKEPYPQYKLQPGKFKGRDENVEIPPKEITVFHTKYGKIAVLICASASDGSTLKNISYVNRNESLFESLDIVLVPAYSSEPMKKIPDYCRAISLAQTCVIYVNDSCFGDHPRVFKYGEEYTKDLQTISAKTTWYSQIKTYTLNLAELRNDRISYFPTSYSNPSQNK